MEKEKLNIESIKIEEKKAKLNWSIKVRYYASALVLFILITTHFTSGNIPIKWLGVLFTASLVNNFLFGQIYKRGKFINTLPYFGILIDIVTITVLVHLTGGVLSPFIFLYFIEVIGASIHVGLWPAIWTSVIIGLLFSLESLIDFSKLLPSHHPFIYTSVIYNFGFGYMALMILSLIIALIFTTYVISFVSARLKIAEQALITANKNLSKQNKKLREIDKLKSEFVSVASHQLRTPLSAIKWSTRMLLDGEFGKLNKEQSELLNKGYLSNERMITLVNDLLSISRIEQGKFNYEFKESAISHLISQAINEIQPIVNEKNLQIIIKWPDEELPIIKIDESKIKLALQNVIENAVKYTPSGGQVTIDTKYDKMNVIITVTDTGIGIPKIQRDKLFSKFFRADNAVKLQTEGSGLGLFIVKNIIDSHGGSISIISEKNKGTAVTIKLLINPVTPTHKFLNK